MKELGDGNNAMTAHTRGRYAEMHGSLPRMQESHTVSTGESAQRTVSSTESVREGGTHYYQQMNLHTIGDRQTAELIVGRETLNEDLSTREEQIVRHDLEPGELASELEERLNAHAAVAGVGSDCNSREVAENIANDLHNGKLDRDLQIEFGDSGYSVSAGQLLNEILMDKLQQTSDPSTAYEAEAEMGAD